jgi:hypothetical protein
MRVSWLLSIHALFVCIMCVFTGGLVLGLTLSSSARDLHEVLHEELIECSFINHVHPWGTDKS